MSGTVSKASHLHGEFNPVRPGSHSAALRYSRLSARAGRINGSTAKRALDIVLSGLLICLFAPAMLLIAAAIKLTSPGPVLFRQERYGAGREVFVIYKFRTMTVVESTGNFTQAVFGDKRVTPVGHILRRSSIDELPQLFNILKGEMTFVGPRPHAVWMDDRFGVTIRHYADRHLIRPGLTGLAQVRGYRGPTDEFDKINSRLQCDRIYIRIWSVLLDLKIILSTPLVLFGKNAF